jgi:hypothetical protein
MCKHKKRKEKVTIIGILNAVEFHFRLVAAGIDDYLWYDIEFGNDPSQYEYNFIY